MLKKIQIGWLRFKGGVDYFASGLKDNTFEIFILGGLMGSLIGGIMTAFPAFVKESGLHSAADNFEEQVNIEQGASLYKFPEDCDMGDNHYLISKKMDGGVQISRGNHKFSEILPIDEQREVTNAAADCMDAISTWASKGNYKFADEFTFVSDVSYSSPILVDDINSDEALTLHIDIQEENSEAPDKLETVVKALDGYDADNDNTALYADEFAKASTAWKSYMKGQNARDPYFEGDEVKHAQNYPTYEYDSLTFKQGLTLFGTGMFATLLFFAGPASTRWSDYDDRERARDKKIADLKVMSGRDKPIL